MAESFNNRESDFERVREELKRQQEAAAEISDTLQEQAESRGSNQSKIEPIPSIRPKGVVPEIPGVNLPAEKTTEQPTLSVEELKQIISGAANGTKDLDPYDAVNLVDQFQDDSK